MKNRYFLYFTLATALVLFILFKTGFGDSEIILPYSNESSVDSSPTDPSSGPTMPNIEQPDPNLNDSIKKSCTNNFLTKLFDDRKLEMTKSSRLSKRHASDFFIMAEFGMREQVIALIDEGHIKTNDLIGEMSVSEYLFLKSNINKHEIFKAIENEMGKSKLNKIFAGNFIIFGNNYSDFESLTKNNVLPDYFQCLNSSNYNSVRIRYIEYILERQQFPNVVSLIRPDNVGLFLDKSPEIAHDFINNMLKAASTRDMSSDFSVLMTQLSINPNSFNLIEKAIDAGVEFPESAVFIACLHNNTQLLKKLQARGVTLRMNKMNLEQLEILYHSDKVNSETFDFIKNEIEISK